MTTCDHPEYRDLLAAVLAAPDDDLPRLVLADWLDENGESARAELIRVQVGIAGLRGALCTCDAGDGPGGYDPDCPYELWGRLKHRAVEILRAHAGRWLADLPAAFRPVLFSPLSDTFRRGFVSAVVGPGPDWVAHADAILAAHPVESVALTCPPEYSADYYAGGAVKVFLPAADGQVSAMSWNPEDALKAALRVRWPAVRNWHLSGTEIVLEARRLLAGVRVTPGLLAPTPDARP